MLLFLSENKLSSNIAQISVHLNSINQKVHSYDQMRNFIVNLGSTKGKNSNNSSPQLTRQQNPLLMSIVDTSGKYLSNVEGKPDKRKVFTYFVK